MPSGSTSSPADDPAIRFGRAVGPFDSEARVEAGTGFGGSPGRRVDGRIFAMLIRDELVVKLPTQRVTSLIEAGDARPFDAGKGTPMREWASVPVADPDRWPELVAEAYAFVKGGSRSRP
jgi:hypothetical protein